MSGGILGRNDGAPRDRPGPAARPLTRRTARRDRRRPRVRALLSVANRDGIVDLARDLQELGVEIYRHRRHARAPRRGRRRGQFGHRPDPRRSRCRRPGQDVPPRGLRRHPRAARRPGPARGAEGAGDRADRPRRRQRQAVRAGHRRQARRHRRGDRDDRRRRRRAPRRGGPERGRGRRGRRPGALHADRRRARASSAPVSPELRAKLAAEAFSTVAAYHAEIAAYLNQISGNTLPAAAWRSSSRRSTTCATARTRTSAPRSTARRRTAAARSPMRPSSGRAAVVQQPARPRRGLPDRPRLHVADRRHRQAHRPGRARLARRAGRGLPARPRDRPGGVVRRDRRGQPRARWRDGPRDRRELVRGGRRARASARRRSASCAASPASSCWPSRPTRPRACATTASPASTSSASPAACWSRAIDELGLDRGRLQVVTQRRPTLEELTDLLFAWRAVRHVRSNAIVLARNGATVGIGAGQAQPPGLGRDRAPPRGRPGQARGHGLGRLLPVPRRHPARGRGRASRRSSSPAARSATRWRSRSPIATTWRWSSPAGGTSGTDGIERWAASA